MNSAPLHRIALMLRGRPVALLPSAFEAIDAQLGAAIAARLDASDTILVHGSAAGLVASPAASAADGGDDAPAAPARLYDLPAPGVARVGLRGVCGRHLDGMAMACGGCDVDRVAHAVRKAGEDPAVRAIVLDCDSPGGSVAGVADCAAAVRSSRKPVVALASDLCASAAYWIASQADALVVGITGEVGSVGVYCAILDKSRAYDAKGLRVDVISSGAHKGAGTPGTSLTDDQRALLQAQILEVAGIFKAAVKAARPEADETVFDGRVLVGASAVKAGLADQTGGIETAIDLALQLAEAAELATRNTRQ